MGPQFLLAGQFLWAGADSLSRAAGDPDCFLLELIVAPPIQDEKTSTKTIG
jgi:hypothetical protein